MYSSSSDDLFTNLSQERSSNIFHSSDDSKPSSDVFDIYSDDQGNLSSDDDNRSQLASTTQEKSSDSNTDGLIPFIRPMTFSQIDSLAQVSPKKQDQHSNSSNDLDNSDDYRSFDFANSYSENDPTKSQPSRQNDYESSSSNDDVHAQQQSPSHNQSENPDDSENFSSDNEYHYHIVHNDFPRAARVDQAPYNNNAKCNKQENRALISEFNVNPNDYEIVKRIGRNRFGTVYLVKSRQGLSLAKKGI